MSSLTGSYANGLKDNKPSTREIDLQKTVIDFASRKPFGLCQVSDVSINSLKSTKIMQTVRDRLESNPDLAKRLKGAFLWKISKDKKIVGEWVTNFNVSPPQISEGNADGIKPDVELQLEDDVFEMLAEGKMTPTLAFMQGKIKAKGKIMLAQRLGELFKSARSKL